MKFLRLTSITFTLFLICLIEIYLNTFISLNFGVYIFFITLVFLGVDFFSQNNAISIFLAGLLYDSFFSTYYLGLYSAMFIFIVIVTNFLVSKYRSTVKVSRIRHLSYRCCRQTHPTAHPIYLTYQEIN